MKKMLESFGGSILSRAEMKNIIGAASATADCGGGQSVTCSGTDCTSKDYDRCYCITASGGVEARLCQIQ